MSNTLRLTLVILVPILILAVLAFAGEQRQVEDKIPWQSDAKNALANAAARDKPTLLYFTADWCPPCKMMKKSTWVDDGVASALTSFTPVRIDIDAQPELAMSYGIESIPTILVVDASGVELSRTVGFVEADALVKLLEKQSVE